MIKLGTMANNIPNSLLLNAADVKLNQTWPVAYGGFADIFEGEFRGSPVALKRINARAIDKVSANLWTFTRVNVYPKAFVREALIWRTLSHHYVLPFLGIYQDPTGPSIMCLVSPFMEHGTLSGWRSEKNLAVPEVETRVRSLSYTTLIKS